MDVRTDIVVIFTILVLAIVISLVLRTTIRSVAEWWEQAWEKERHRRVAGRLLRGMVHGSKDELVAVALAVALSPYRWPGRTNSANERFLSAQERYGAFFASLSDAELKEWIGSKVRSTHSLFLTLALESMKSDGRRPCSS